MEEYSSPLPGDNPVTGLNDACVLDSLTEQDFTVQPLRQ